MLISALGVEPMNPASSIVEVRVVDVCLWEAPGDPTPFEGAILETSDSRRVVIILGSVDAAMLALVLTRTTTSRPLTHPFYGALLSAAGVQVARVVIDALVEHTFTAKVQLVGDGDTVVDARPSDALALALVMGAPVFAAEVLLHAGDWDPSRISKHAAEVAENVAPGFWRRPDPGKSTVEISGAGRAGAPASQRLSRREEQVLRLVAAGLTNVEVSLALGLSPFTVTRHLANVYSKLGVSRRVQAVAYLTKSSAPA